MVLISIHAPARGATTGRQATGCAGSISIHAPARGATYQQGIERMWSRKISIHAPARGATIYQRFLLLIFLFQFTPLREGRHIRRVRPKQGHEISIHAPARGATRHRKTTRATKWISIHAPARGATANQKSNGDDKPISIHAPARGATGKHRPNSRRAENFNSRPCERGDNFKSMLTAMGYKFQFTPLREGRRNNAAAAGAFNQISIHAPARGATNAAKQQQRKQKISIHAPARGATPAGRVLVLILLEFQFTPLREGRPEHSVPTAVRTSDFNSRPCERGDRERL